MARPAPPSRFGWDRLSLSSRFGLVLALVLVAAGLVIGRVTTARIEAAVVRNQALATAIYMDSLLAPISQQFATADRLSPGAVRALTELFANTPLGERVMSYRFWGPEGEVLESSDRALIGRTFPPDPHRDRAWAGEVAAEFEGPASAENADEAALGLPLLEIYAPIREAWSGRIIAVAEFYEVNRDLAQDLRDARTGAWLTVALVLGVTGLSLYGIVLGGNRTITAQRGALAARLGQLREMSARNTELRLRIQAAAGRSAAQTEQAMRRIGADLHDGPAQNLAFAILRLDSAAGTAPPELARDLAEIRGAVAAAMDEVRGLARGLALPDIAGRPLPRIARAAAEAHALRSGHPVAITINGESRADPGPNPGDPVRITLFRFIQEGLSNASRHAGGRDLSLTLTVDPARLTAEIADRGPGPQADPGGMGLSGLRDRIEALGGSLSFAPRPGGGALLTMTIDLTDAASVKDPP
jgi:signal transduction histidine kinase